MPEIKAYLHLTKVPDKTFVSTEKTSIA